MSQRNFELDKRPSKDLRDMPPRSFPFKNRNSTNLRVSSHSSPQGAEGREELRLVKSESVTSI